MRTHYQKIVSFISRSENPFTTPDICARLGTHTITTQMYVGLLRKKMLIRRVPTSTPNPIFYERVSWWDEEKAIELIKEHIRAVNKKFRDSLRKTDGVKCKSCGDEYIGINMSDCPRCHGELEPIYISNKARMR